MSSVLFSRGVGAAGTLAVAALLGTAPIASADNNGNEIDWSTLASPAATFPELTYSNTFTLGLGSTTDTWTTIFTGSGLPTTTEVTTTLPTGVTEFGSSDSFSSELLTSATHGDLYTTAYTFLDIMTGGTTQDYFTPLTSFFETF